MFKIMRITVAVLGIASVLGCKNYVDDTLKNKDASVERFDHINKNQRGTPLWWNERDSREQQQNFYNQYNFN